MLFFNHGMKKRNKTPKNPPQKSAKIMDSRNANKKAAHIFKGVFQIATVISDFDLKLVFFSNKINHSADTLDRMFSDVASSSEEISTSTTQIVGANSELANTIDSISQDAIQLNQNTEQSNGILKSIQSENEEMMVFSKDMDQSIGDLLTVIHRINEAVKGINKISDQTKLLSLNAAIEAAKAGAAGKGFAVVADEIRSLSATTKELTLNIDSLLVEMNAASSKSKGSVDKTIASIGKVSNSIQAVSDVMAASTKATEKITDRISGAAETSRRINDSLQESSAALESASNDIQDLSTAANELKNISGSINEVSQLVGNAEEKVNHLAIAAGEMVTSKLCGLSNDDFIETVENAINAHKKWMQNVKSMAKDMRVIPIQTDEHKCGFGHFYYAVRPSSEKLAALWESVEALHHSLHKTGDLVIGHIEANDARSAMSDAKEAEKLSGAIIEKFQQMIQITKQMTLSNELVF